MLNAARTLIGLTRSWRIYRTNGAHARALDQLYASFVRPGDLVFDIGAHVGDRVASFRRLGARVVAVEPQPGPAALLRVAHALDRNVRILSCACGAKEGLAAMHINSRNPTVSTLSEVFVRAAKDASGWSDQVWDTSVEVRLVTLDNLIRDHGLPSFAKIDVEGFEDQVLLGLSQPLRALSFEFTTLQRDVVHRALARLCEIGPYRFNYSPGESLVWAWTDFKGARELRVFLDDLPARANSGDVYAVLDQE